MDSDISACACMQVYGACAYMWIGYVTKRECDVIYEGTNTKASSCEQRHLFEEVGVKDEHGH